jgi:hypothetical protein
MKKLLFTTALAAGLALSVYGQGIVVANTLNTSLDSAATTGGLVWTNDLVGHTGLWDGYNYNLGIELLGGATSSSLSPIAVLIPNPGGGIYTGDNVGVFKPYGMQSVYQVPGVSGSAGIGWVQLNVWWYELSPAATTYAEARGILTAYTGSVLFQNPVSAPDGTPPTGDQYLTAMPALVLTPVPEPTVFALAGLGLASLLIFRRRK